MYGKLNICNKIKEYFKEYEKENLEGNNKTSNNIWMRNTENDRKI